MQGASNFRDVGGYLTTEGQRVRRGHLFRSDHLAALTSDDLAQVRHLGIGHSLDFRGTAESAATPYEIAGVQRLSLAIEPTVMARMQALATQGVVPTTEETVDMMRETYRDFVNHNASTFGRFLKHVLAHPTPQVFHCTAGKDRTGFVVAMLLAALGVPREAIVDDYLESARRCPPATLADMLIALSGETPSARMREAIETIADVRADWLDTALRTAERGHGSLDGYLETALGVDAGLRDRIRARLTA